jgi:anti-sigma regulatory factor (Ser/Thr protein kinase)
MDTSTLELTDVIVTEHSRLRIPSRPEWIEKTIDFLKTRAQLSGACPEGRANKLGLALHEALSNAVIHGNLEVPSALKEREDDAFARTLAERAADPYYAERTVTIDVAQDADCCRWSFTDEGPGFDYRRYLYREPGPDAILLSSGRGIVLMKAFTDELHYDQGGRKVTLTMHRSAGVEKRTQPREPLQQRVQVAPIRADGSVDWDRAHDAVTRDLSATGIGLLQDRLATSERVLVGVEVDGRTLYVPAQVRHCRPAGPGMVELGCRFTIEERSPVPAGQESPHIESAVELLLSRRRTVPRRGHERRSAPRETYTERVEIHDPAGSPPLVGFARDLSRTGIAFITTSPLPCQVRVLSLSQPDGPPLRLQVRIVRCSSLSSGFYDIGARFVGPVPG